MTPTSDEVDRPDGFIEVLARRSMCREFDARTIDSSSLDTVLAAAFRGPSAGNTDALDLVVLYGEDVERYWSTTLSAERRERFPWPGLLVAPVLVLVYVDPAAYVQRYAEPDKAHTGLGEHPSQWPVPYWFVDGGAAVMAMLLAAETEGLGALLFGQFEHEPVLRTVFGVPQRRRAVGTVALGHRVEGGRHASRSAARGRADPSTRIHRGGWSGAASDRTETQPS